MRRLTEQDEQGNWCVKGLPWKDTYVGQVITENTNQKIYGALCKLKDYEVSGLDPEEAYELAERNKAKKHELINNGISVCKECGAKVFIHYAFCRDCGQRLDWGE